MEGTAQVAERVGRLVRGGVTIRTVAALALVAIVSGVTLAADFAADSHVDPIAGYLAEPATPFTFSVQNTGVSDSIGAVEIARPAKDWTILDCPVAPPAWTTVQSSNWCRYRSPAGPDGDLAPGAMSSDFQVLVATEGGLRNLSGTWKVTVSKSDTFDKKSLLTTAAVEPPGLTTTAYSFRILDAIVVETAPATAGAPCPTGAHEAVTGSQAIVVICGENRTNMTLTPSANQASLGGTFIAGATDFTSGPVGARSSESVVLGWWTDVEVTNLSGPDKTIVARVGASPNQTSPFTTLSGYEALNQPPAASATTATTNEDTTTGPITLSATDADGDAMTFSIDSGPANGELSPISAAPCSATPGTALTCTATVTYTPDLDFNGPDEFTYVAADTFGAPSAPATVSLTVNAVNDAPSFTSGGDVTVNEDSGPYSAAWATAISVGPANEAGQLVTFQVSNDNNALFATQPAVAPDGTLSFTPAPDANGSALVTVELSDDGGTALGGVDTSPSQAFTLTVNAVNDAPSFTSGGDVTVNEDSGPYSAAWATAISVGPANEAGQLVTFQVSNDNNALFATQPAVAPDGTLSFTPAPDANGSALVTVELSDDGGTALGGVDTSPSQAFTLTVNAVNDAPSFHLPTDPDQVVIQDSGAQAVAGFATNISAGPADESGQTLTFNVSNDNSTLFSSQPDIDESTGDLTYTPASGATGSATVTVTLSDDGGTANGGVDTSAPQDFTVTVSPPNATPVAVDETVTTDEDTPVTITLTATDADDDDLTFSIVPGEGPFIGTLDAISAPDCTTTPNTCTATVLYTPAANLNGGDGFRFTVHDGTIGSNQASVTITVDPVNDAPSFTEGADESILEDSGSHTVNGWATAISTGGGTDEAGQVLTFVVTNNTNPGLFSVAPAVDSDGDLTYTLAADAFGSATITLKITDDGGTANGGVDESAEQSFDIVVAGVNDAPAFTKGADQNVNEDAGPQSVAGWATGISAGPTNESGQTLAFVVTGNTNPGLFLAAPAVSASGTLTFTTAANQHGSATITLKITDDGGTANGGVDESATQMFDISVSAVNDPPTSPGRAYGANSLQANMQRSIDLASGLLVGAADAADLAGNGSYEPTFTVGTVNGVAPVSGTITTTIAGTGTVVANAATGAFTINPAPGVTGDVSFTFTVCDSGDGSPASECSSAVTASFNIASPVIWFVDDSVADGGSGRLTDPFDTLADAVAAIGSDQNERVFLYSGSYSTGITLNTGGWLVGQPVTDTSFDNVMAITPPAATIARPTIGSGSVTVGGTVGLATNAKVRGVAIASTTATGMSGSGGLTGVDVDQVSITTTIGTGLSLNNVTGTVNLSSLTVGAAPNGVSLTGVGATVAIAGGSIAGTTGADVLITGGTGTFTYNGTIADDQGTLVSISGATGGTKSFGGAISDGNDGDGNGISLTNNTGATVTFTGGITLSTGTSPALTATSGGTINVSGTNTLATTTGTALTVTNTTIGASDLTFQSISANGAASGIVLTNTGSSGGLIVTGSGTANSGGTIQNTTGPGIAANNTQDLSLTRILISNPGTHGIEADNLRGTSLIADSSIQNWTFATGNGLDVVNNNTNLASLTVSSTTFNGSGTSNDGIFMEAQGSSSMTLSVQGSTFTDMFGDGIQVNGITGATGDVRVTVQGSSFTNASALGNGGISLNPFGGIHMYADINGNTFDDIMRPLTNLGGIGITNGLTAASDITIRNNAINDIDGARGITFTADGSGPTKLLIDNNTIDRLGSTSKHGISINLINAAQADVTVINNDIGQAANLWTAGDGTGNGILFTTQDSSVLRGKISNNVVSANTGTVIEVVRVRAIESSTLNAIVTGNTITDTSGTHVEFDASTGSGVVVGGTINLDIGSTSNTLPAGGVGVVKLTENAAPGDLNVVQASAAAVSAANNGATVTVTGAPDFGAPAPPTPALPTLP